MGFFTGPILVSDHYQMMIEGLGSHTYSLDALRTNFRIITWDSVCWAALSRANSIRQQAIYER
jgi:hypothetical protein